METRQKGGLWSKRKPRDFTHPTITPTDEAPEVDSMPGIHALTIGFMPPDGTRKVLLVVNFIMTANVEQDDLSVGHYYRQGNAIAVRETHRLDSLQFTGQMVIFQVGLERVDLEVAQDSGELGAQFTMLVGKLFSGAGKTGGPDQGIHAQASNPNSLINSSALPFFTRPAL